MSPWDMLLLLKEVERVAERARMMGFPNLQSGLIAVTMATILGLEDEMIAALVPVVAKAKERAEIWRQSGLLDPEE